MERMALGPISVLRLLLISGLFAVAWMIFGAGSGSAQAAEPAPSPGQAQSSGQPGDSGLLAPLRAPVAEITTAARPVTGAAGPVSAVTKPLAGTVESAAAAVAPVLRQVSAPVTGVNGALAPVVAPVTGLVADTVLAPVAKALDPVTSTVTTLTGSPATRPAVVVPPAATVPPAKPAASAPGGTSPAGTFLDAAAVPAAHGVLPVAALAALSPAPSGMDKVRSDVPGSPAAMHSVPDAPAGGTPGLPGDGGTATVPAPVSFGTGSAAPAGTGHSAVADLSYRLVLPATRAGAGSSFSFVLPWAPAREPGFSPG
jgi:hypothetical protein